MTKYLNILIIIFSICLSINSLSQNTKAIDTVKISGDELDSLKPKKKSSIDTIVNYKANESVRLNLKTKDMRLKGESQLNYKTQKLEAEIIEINFNSSTLKAMPDTNETGKKFGYPKFIESGTTYVGENIKFNFKTNKGAIGLGETEISNGFFFGEKIKRVSQTELFVKNGNYTTCDAPHPHYYFGSSEMKLIAQDKIFLDPMVFYVEDIPLFALPIGLFFPARSGRSSGLIVPTYSFSRNRGVMYENFGFYWAASDYFDSQITFNFYSKGGYLAKNHSNWVLRDVYNGSYDLEYGKTRNTPDEDFADNYRLRLTHNHKLTPNENLVANLNFFSANFNRNTSNNINDRVTQNVTSNASYSKNYDGGTSIGLNYNREQNIITNAHNQSLTANYNLPNQKLFDIGDKEFAINTRISANLYEAKNYTNQQTNFADGSSRIDSGFTREQRNYISFQPQLIYNLPRIYFFNIIPSVSFGGNGYVRRIKERKFDSLNSRIVDEYEYGAFGEGWANFGLSLSTRFYGILSPKLGSLNSLRHTVEPSISYNFNPDFTSESLNYFSTYKDTRQNRVVRYNRYINEGGSHASEFKGQSMGITLRNRFEAKVAQGDTLEDKNIEILQLDFSSNYNLQLDSFKLSPVQVSFRTPALPFVNFSGNATFNPYNQVFVNDTIQRRSYWRDDKEYAISASNGLARLTDISFTLSTSLSDRGFTTQPNITNNQVPKDSMGIGDRFQNRRDLKEVDADIFADHSEGYMPSPMSWTLNLGAQFAYREPQKSLINRTFTLNADLNFNLTTTWKINANAYYDVVNNQLVNTSIGLIKDLHCWDLNFRWYPTGFNRGYYIRFGIKASQLRDLQYEKREDPIFR